MTDIPDYQREFIDLAREFDALRFGEFTLKSGRASPYFFNAGAFATGRSLAVLGRCYAAAIMASGLEFDMLFGPAYKGIPLAAVTAAALSDHHQRDVPFAYNRKERKDHGEGGMLVGAPLSGRVLLIDDVITAGTAIREILPLIRGAGATATGVVVGLDRQERGQGPLSAVQELSSEEGLRVLSIIDLSIIIRFVEADAGLGQWTERLNAYRRQYGVGA
jgi:orotate phosphoribosyltransferase